MFYDRIDAGQQLATVLKKYKSQNDTIVLALPRGGVVPGFIIAQELHLPLDIIMVKKLGHPTNPEYAIGAVSMKGRIGDGHEGVSQEYVKETTKKIQELLKQRYKMYHGDRPPVELKNKTVIVVDDGVATGKTLTAALELIRKEKAKEIIVALPVGPTDTIERLKSYADNVIYLESYKNFHALGLYYENFNQVSDNEVKEYLEKAHQNEISAAK